MVISKIKKASLIFGLTVLPVTAVGLSYAVNNASGFRLTKASPYTAVLDIENAPDLTGTEGSMVDEHGVTWEYHNASVNTSGHITINAQGYFGVSSSSQWGYTGITGITANFSEGELWLLSSLDGTTWSECEILTSGHETNTADNWRYIRFYSYADTINISSISFGYSCSGITNTEDVDAAHIGNVISVTSNITYEKEENDVSPLGNSTEAIKFTKTGSDTSILYIGLGKTYKMKEIIDKKIEYDFKVSSNYAKTFQLAKNASGNSSTVDSSKHSSFVCNNIQGDWYHIEIPVAALASLTSGYDYKNGTVQDHITPDHVAEREVNSIKLNAGTCIIDNLRISSTPSNLGTYNNGTSFNKNSVYWYKVSWTGKFYSCVMTFSDNSIAEQVQLGDEHLEHGSPFYIMGKKAGTVTVTATVVSGYNRKTHTITRTLTVK